jgi:hypothetical protein
VLLQVVVLLVLLQVLLLTMLVLALLLHKGQTDADKTELHAHNR